MITRELFKDQLENMQQMEDLYEKLYEIRVDILESPLYGIPSAMFDTWTKSVATEEGCDLIYWWMFEDVEKIIYEKDNEIYIETIDDLYDYLRDNNLFI